MTLLPIEKRIRLSGMLIAAGLIVLFVSLLWSHPLAFLAYLVIGCPLMLGGALLYLYSLATKEGTVRSDVIVILAIVALPLSFSSCGSSDGVNSALKETAARKQTEEKAHPELPVFDASTATGRVFGNINFEGPAPEVPSVTIGGDALCKTNAVNVRNDKEMVTADHKVRNAIVYVRTGYEGRSYTPPANPVVIDQRGCVYAPHVISVMKGQKVRILNSDDVFHNVHAQDGQRSEFNIGQAKAGAEDVQTFSRAVMPFRIACDFHRWMSAYAGVFDHPFHTTSGLSGQYELRLPAGTYEVVAWHEEFGEQVSKAEVSDKGTVELNFKFTASAEHKGRKRG